MKQKIFEHYPMYFYVSNLRPPGPGSSWTLGPSFEQTSWKTLGNATYQISMSEPSGSEEDDFLIYLYSFLWFEPRAFLDPGTFIWTNFVKDH